MLIKNPTNATRHSYLKRERLLFRMIHERPLLDLRTAPLPLALGRLLHALCDFDLDIRTDGWTTSLEQLGQVLRVAWFCPERS
jgi:hypothetical protein